MATPTLTFLSQPFTGKTVELTKKRYLLGRKSNNDIPVDHGTVSGVHCELVRQEDGSYKVVDDCMSTNGTRISGMPVMEHQLQNSDILQVGSIEIMYDTNTEPASSITSINTHIRVATNPIIPNEDIALAPSWLKRGDSAWVNWGFRGILAALGLIIVILSVAIALKVM